MADVFTYVLMPFHPDFEDVYVAIQGACRDAEKSAGRTIECRRADSTRSPGRITEEIFRDIEGAHVIVAEITGNNPNVMYELGYAHALKKPVILLNQSIENSPFDIRDFRQVVYSGKRINKECRTPLAESIAEVVGRGGPTPNAAPTTGKSGGGPSGPSATSPPGRVILIDYQLIARVQQQFIGLRLARTQNDPSKMARIGEEILSLANQIATGRPAVANKEEYDVLAGGLGNCAVELERGGLLELAESLYKRVIAIHPTYPGVHAQYADYLADRGLADEALAELNRLRELDPLDRRIATVETKLAGLKGQYDSQFADRLRKEFENDPGNSAKAVPYLSYISLNGVAARAEFERAVLKWKSSTKDATHIPDRVLADFYATHDLDDEAVTVYESILPKVHGAERADLLHNLAQEYRALKRPKDTIRATWTEAYKLKRDDPQIRAAFSLWLALEGDDLESAQRVSSGLSLE